MLIDTNLLILYFIGEFNPERISTFRRTKKFNFQDFCLLKAISDRFIVKVTTPNILTEISNLSGDIPLGLREKFFRHLRKSFELFDEQYFPSSIAAASDIFPRFGLADSAIAKIANQRYLVLTDDFALANYLGSINADVINFTHLLSIS